MKVSIWLLDINCIFQNKSLKAVLRIPMKSNRSKKLQAFEKWFVHECQTIRKHQLQIKNTSSKATQNYSMSTLKQYKHILKLSRPDLREPFYFSIWLGQGVMWGGHSMFCISVCLAECGSQSAADAYRCL
jgi:hypothetical protein